MQLFFASPALPGSPPASGVGCPTGHHENRPHVHVVHSCVLMSLGPGTQEVLSNTRCEIERLLGPGDAETGEAGSVCPPSLEQPLADQPVLAEGVTLTDLGGCHQLAVGAASPREGALWEEEQGRAVAAQNVLSVHPALFLGNHGGSLSFPQGASKVRCTSRTPPCLCPPPRRPLATRRATCQRQAPVWSPACETARFALAARTSIPSRTGSVCTTNGNKPSERAWGAPEDVSSLTPGFPLFGAVPGGRDAAWGGSPWGTFGPVPPQTA